MEHDSYLRDLQKSLASLRIPSILRRLPDHPEVPGLGHCWWKKFFALVDDPDEESILRPTELIGPLDKIPRLVENGRGLVTASRFAISCGLFSLGGAMRLRGRDILLECLLEGLIQPDSLEYVHAMAALIEVGRWDDFLRSMMHLPESMARERRLMGTLLTILAPVEVGIGNLFPTHTIPQDPLFSACVAGKRVAVVGPASSSSGEGQAIDCYDLVARFNYREHGLGLDPLHKGERCDLVYFNRAQTEYLISECDLSRFPQTPRWIIARRQKHVEAIASALKAEASLSGRTEWKHRYRSTPVYEIPLVRGLLNAVPNAVLDLLHGGALAVDVYHADFMLSMHRTQDYSPWIKNVSDATLSVIKCFAGVHDPISQLSVMKTAWRSGKVHGDGPFRAALQLSEQGYMDALQILYGNAMLMLK